MLLKLLNKIIVIVLDAYATVVKQPKPMLFAGEGSSLLLADNIIASGPRSVLLVTDKILMELGLLDAIRQRLEAAGIEAHVYDGVLPDPTTDQVEACAAVGRAGQCDVVLGVGGGSVLDTAKAVGALLTSKQSLKFMAGYLRVFRKPLPTYLVPTTAGTGSEATVAAVISDPVTHEKMKMVDYKLVPKAAALDAGLMRGMPPGVTAATGMDAMTHAIEAYVSRMSTEETDGMALQCCRFVFQDLPKAFADGNNIEARHNMAMAAAYGGFAFSRANVGYVHAFAHNLGAKYGIPHGLANSLMLPSVLRFYASKGVESLDELADALGYASAEAFITAVEALLRELQLPERIESLKAGDIPELAKLAIKEAGLYYAVPAYFSQAEAEALLSALLPE